MEKDFTECEEISQLKEAVAKLIKNCGLTKSEIAHHLGVTPSTVSMWLDLNGDGRTMKVEQAKKLLKMVKNQPRIILTSMEDVEAAIENELNLRFGKGTDPNSF